MVIQESRLASQKDFIQNDWMPSGCIGTLEAATGYGKTYVAILVIKMLNKGNPGAETIVVVPSEKLYEDWVGKGGHIETHGLLNVTVYIINSYVKQTFYNCRLLILDEIHNFAAETFINVFNITVYKYVLGLTATLERLDGRHELIMQYCPILKTISLETCERNGWVTKSKIFNLGLEIDLSDDEKYQSIQKQVNTNYARFGHSYELAKACGVGDSTIMGVKFRMGSEDFASSYDSHKYLMKKTGAQWRNWWAEKNGWKGEKDHDYSPAALRVYAVLYRKAIQARKEYLYNHPSKLPVIKQITESFPVQTIMFGESTEFADKIQKMLGNVCKCYHSKLESEERRFETIKTFKTKPSQVIVKYKKVGVKTLKKEILKAFNDKEIRVLSTVRALDEGYNVEGIQLVVQHSYNRSKRQQIQRQGRGLRVDFSNLEKIAIIINIYLKGTQEEKWLKEKQLNQNAHIIRVNSVEEIVYRLSA